MIFDYTNPGHLKIALLSKGINVLNSARRGLSDLWQEKIYSFVNTDWVDEKILLPSDILLDNRVDVGCHYRTASPWKLELLHNEKLVLKQNDEFICDVSHIQRPAYYGRRISDGYLTQSIGVSCANHGVSFFINDHCQYFNRGEECKFCSLVPTQEHFSDTLRFKKVDQVKETLSTILELKSKIDFIQLSGGSFYDHNKEVRLYIPYIYGIRSILKKFGLLNEIPIHLTCMPPNSLSLINELYDSGLTTISFDLECTNQKYFEKYCPGKSTSYGFDKMWSALEYAYKIFGMGKVFSIIILGIEPFSKSLEGVIQLLAKGIIPTLNIYHHDPYSAPKMDIREPNIEGLIHVTYQISKVFSDYNAKAGLLGCAHYDIGHEIRKGFFDV